MIKKYKKFILAVIFLVFLCGNFSCFSTNKILAAELEVKSYPTIAGKTITPETKLPDFAIYLFNAGMLVGVAAVFISLAIAGVMYALSPIKSDLLGAAKDRVSGAISGLLILVSTYLIITTINPQLKAFSTTPLPAAEVTAPAVKQIPGVYLYNNAGCSGAEAQLYTSSAKDLGPSLRKKVNSAKNVPDIDNDTYYVSILYETINFQGKCQYINPSGCQPSPIGASSASVYQYNFDPSGDGVYFYHKSFFNDCGGYFYVPSSQINGLYIKKLDDLTFTMGGNCDASSPAKNNCGVPEEEQSCVKYDKDGKCASDGRRCPTLSGENISSIKIGKDYLVLLSYAGPGETCKSVMNDSCQEFPTPDDINKTGPLQIKWDEIRNHGGVVPNCVTIVPII